jgi:geranylgeranyl reductase family protein
VKTDVAVVGGGPAGARAAYVLARQGARVVVFDPSHPREKPCGGGVSGRALALVADALNLRELNAVAIRSARFTGDGTAGGTRQGQQDVGARILLDGEALIVSSRSRFDAALLDAAIGAGAEYEPVRVLDVMFARDGITITTSGGTRRADFIVGADGPNSLLRRRVAQMFRRDQLSIATGFFAHGRTGQEIVVEMLPERAGYIWSFPRSDHLAIGICAQADAGMPVSVLRHMVSAWIERMECGRAVSLRPYSWPIPSLGASDFDGLEVAGSRWCLVGDAAGLVDPITREGIFFALATGQWAAEALANRSASARYSTRVHDEAIPELARAARLKAAFFRPRFTRLLLAALDDSGAIRRIMGDLIAGRQSYRTLKWRLLRTLELGLACRSLITSRL